jgi:antitoxin component of MazEF toxin-antitoxin module
MRTRIIRIGHSQGIRIPKKLLEQSGLGPEVELEVLDQWIIIRAPGHPREGWAESIDQEPDEATPEEEQEEEAWLRQMHALGATDVERDA